MYNWTVSLYSDITLIAPYLFASDEDDDDLFDDEDEFEDDDDEWEFEDDDEDEELELDDDL